MGTMLSPFHFVGDTWTCGSSGSVRDVQLPPQPKLVPGKFMKIHMFDTFSSLSTYFLGSPFYKGPPIQSFLKALFL